MLVKEKGALATIRDIAGKLKAVVSKDTIAKANYTIKVIKPLHHSFFKTLKNKLMWGADKRN